MGQNTLVYLLGTSGHNLLPLPLGSADTMEHEIMGQKIPAGLPHYQSSLWTPTVFALEPVYPITAEQSKGATDLLYREG